MHFFKFSLLTVFSMILAGCASYTPKPLTQAYVNGSLQAPNVHQLQLHSHIKINFKRPLTPEQLAVIAVLTNPDLAVIRAQQHISQAQVFAAGLLPDPVLNMSLDHPLSMAGNTNGYSIGPDFDLGALFTHALKVQAAQLNNQQVKLNVAWQEWLVANQVKLLANDIASLQKQKKLLQDQLHLIRPYYVFAQQNYKKHNITLLHFNEQKQKYRAVLNQLTDLNISLADKKLQLNHMLGFPPNSSLVLQATVNCVPKVLNATMLFDKALQNRLDLKALKSGYQQQEVKVHQAIDGQFPHFSFGFNQSRDTSNVKTFGVNLSFNLPLWNRNQGNIAIERSTRAELAAAYIARIQDVRSNISKLVDRLNILKYEKNSLTSKLGAVSLGHYKYELIHGDINLTTFLMLENDWYTYHQRLIQINQSLIDNWDALQIAIGKKYQGVTC